MRKDSIRAFLNTAIINPAAGNEKLSFSKMSRVLYSVFAFAGIAFTFPFRFPNTKDSLQIKLALLIAMLFTMGFFAFLSIKSAQKTKNRNIFKSIIFFDLQCSCLVFIIPIITYTFYESMEPLVVGVIESMIVNVLFALTTIARVRYKIKRGEYTNNGVAKSARYPLIISMIAYIIIVEVGKRSIGMVVQAVILVACSPVIVLTFNIMQLYYARKYNMKEMLSNESFDNRAMLSKS